MAKQKKKTKNQVRIIGGKLKNSLLSFNDIDGLRPTGARSREVLFNWLMADIVNSTVLDAFAGSGALGFEALSRGAKQVVFLDKEPRVIQAITTQCHQFQCQTQTKIIQANALKWLKEGQITFDIILIDPPFANQYQQVVIDLIVEHHKLNKQGLLYIEQAKSEPLPLFPNTLKIHKTKQLGQVQMILAKKD